MPRPDNRLIEPGCKVTLHYTLSLATGKTADTTRGGEPAVLVVGAGDLHAAFEGRLLGLGPGESRRFEIPCMEAFGPSETGNVHALPRAEFPPEMKIEPGLVIGFELPSGEEVPGTVVAVSEHEVRIDFNHPLAGHDLVFEVEVLSVEPPSRPA
ncbi:FKBP-type peptidyl-prolyl cis-trans isomerase [Sulfurifustis variabilis]|uniref:FKBP-type peptidyl-prolyl cis-trans isomerase n=1 Tax=Sulfurifustis variabilis TaxID=1675686 RepID=UPI000BBA8914|nr:peptidylprolyl isomerase [Sulfurifustis variabilis]